jgi:uncharacterized protein YdgA (DUF945 family)
MKKSILLISFISCCLLLIGSYWVGERAKNELQQQIAKLDNPELHIELLRYKKSFFTAQADINMTISAEGNPPLQLTVHSDILHLPYKAQVTSIFSLVDKKVEAKINHYFQTEQWLTSHMDLNIFGGIDGEFILAKGGVSNEHETITTDPMYLTYHYHLEDHVGSLAVNWSGLHGQINNEKFVAEGLSFNTNFTNIIDSELFNYQYQLQLKQFDFFRALQHLSLKGIVLQGKNTVSQENLTVDTESDWKINEVHNGQQVYRNNQVVLLLSKLNIEALYGFKASLNAQDFSPAALSQLISLGAHIDLQKLHSETPWGEINGTLLMDIQTGINPLDLQENPLSLIDYTNGHLHLNVPQGLVQQPTLSSVIQMGVNSGVLQPQGDQLSLEASLDRGELTINGNVISM